MSNANGPPPETKINESTSTPISPQRKILFGAPSQEVGHVDPLKDVVIHDRQYLSVSDMKNSFYHELIRNCAAKLQSTESTNPAIVPATRMVDLVRTKRDGTFVYCEHYDKDDVAKVKYFALNREQAIRKLEQDLELRLKNSDVLIGSKLPGAPAPPVAQPKPPPRPLNPKLDYAVKLVAAVSMALDNNERTADPAQAVSVLDRPLEINKEPETDSLRKLRLSLRHRFLAAAGTASSMRDYARILLKGWGISYENAVGTKRKRSSLASSSSAATPATTHTTPKVKKTHSSNTNKIRRPADESPDENCNLGPWTDEEKTVYIQALETYGWGNWKEVTSMIPTRCQRQVCSYSRYLAIKIPEVKTVGKTDSTVPQAFRDHLFAQRGRKPKEGPDALR